MKSPISGNSQPSSKILTIKLTTIKAKNRSRPKSADQQRDDLKPRLRDRTIRYVKSPSIQTTKAAEGLAIISGTIYPGTTNPENGHPQRRLKKDTTKTPIQTVVITDWARLFSGNSCRGNITWLSIPIVAKRFKSPRKNDFQFTHPRFTSSSSLRRCASSPLSQSRILTVFTNTPPYPLNPIGCEPGANLGANSVKLLFRSS